LERRKSQPPAQIQKDIPDHPDEEHNDSKLNEERDENDEEETPLSKGQKQIR
jgi:hypothetical protein